MKLSLIGYPALWRRQSWMLEKLAEQVDLRVEVPPRWKDKTPDENLSTLNHATHRTLFTDRIRFHVQPGIARSINAWDPDAVVSWVEPHHLNSAFINRVDAQLIYFTWETLPTVPQNRLLRWSDTRSYDRVDALICGSEKAEDRAREKGFDGPIDVFPQTGINTDFFRPMDVDRSEWRVEEDERVVLFVGRIAEEKGLEYLIHAMEGLDATLLLAGEGPDRERFEQLADEVAPNRVRFLGWQDYDALPALYNIADVFAFPSITTETWEEQFGYAMFEAMACGTPVVASDSGAIPDVTPDTVRHVEEGNVDVLRDALKEAMEDNGEKGRKWVEDNLTNAVVAGRYRRWVEEVVG